MPQIPVLLVPGLACTERAFAEVLPALWPFGSVTIANHRRGQSIAEIAAAILAEAPDRFALLGFSMGGYIAFEMYRQAPDRIARLCCLATSARPDSTEQTENRLRQITLAERGRLRAVAKGSFPFIVHPKNREDERLRNIHIDMFAATGPEIYVAQQRAIMARPDSRLTLATISCPTAVIVGEADEVTGVDAAEDIAAGIAGATFTRVKRAGHFLPLEQPGPVQAALAKWMTI